MNFERAPIVSAGTDQTGPDGTAVWMVRPGVGPHKDRSRPSGEELNARWTGRLYCSWSGLGQWTKSVLGLDQTVYGMKKIRATCPLDAVSGRKPTQILMKPYSSDSIKRKFHSPYFMADSTSSSSTTRVFSNYVNAMYRRVIDRASWASQICSTRREGPSAVRKIKHHVIQNGLWRYQTVQLATPPATIPLSSRACRRWSLPRG